MSQEYLNNIRSQIGMGMQDVRNADQRSKDQKYTYSGNPNMPYNYSYDQNMGGQNPSLGRYRPPMMDANGGWQDSGGYAYNLPTNSGPYRGSFGQGFGPPMPQFNGFGSGSVGNMYDQYGRGNYIRGGNGQPVAGRMPPQGGPYPPQNQSGLNDLVATTMPVSDIYSPSAQQDQMNHAAVIPPGPGGQQYINDPSDMGNFRNVFSGQNQGVGNYFPPSVGMPAQSWARQLPQQGRSNQFMGNNLQGFPGFGPTQQGIGGAVKPGSPTTVNNPGRFNPLGSQYNPLGSQIGPEAFQVNPQAFQATQQLLQQINARSKPGMPASNNFNPTNGTQAPPVDPTNPYQNYNLPPTFRYY